MGLHLHEGSFIPESMRGILFTGILCALSAAGCSSDDEPACGEPAEDYVVSSGAVDHTCGHVSDGPFGDVHGRWPRRG